MDVGSNLLDYWDHCSYSFLGILALVVAALQSAHPKKMRNRTEQGQELALVVELKKYSSEKKCRMIFAEDHHHHQSFGQQHLNRQTAVLEEVPLPKAWKSW